MGPSGQPFELKVEGWLAMLLLVSVKANQQQPLDSSGWCFLYQLDLDHTHPLDSISLQYLKGFSSVGNFHFHWYGTKYVPTTVVWNEWRIMPNIVIKDLKRLFYRK